MQTATVYLVDDDPAIRDSMTALLKSVGLSIKAFASAEIFLNNYSQEQAGCLILDIKLPMMGGLELQEELINRNIHIPIIIISGHAKIPDSVKALKAGAIDFLEKPFDSNQLIACIQDALVRNSEDRKLRSEQDKIQASFERLTAREKQVMQLLTSSHDNKQAAKKLAISPRTIEVHRANILEKMQAKDIGQLVAMALRCSLFL